MKMSKKLFLLVVIVMMSLSYRASAQEIVWHYDSDEDCSGAGPYKYIITSGIQSTFSFYVFSDGTAAIVFNIYTDKGSAISKLIGNSQLDQTVTIEYNDGKSSELYLPCTLWIPEEDGNEREYPLTCQISKDGYNKYIQLLSTYNMTAFSILGKRLVVTKPTAKVFSKCVETAISHLPDKSKWTKPRNTQSVSKTTQSAPTAKKPQMQCTLSDLLTKPFGISYHREFSSYKSRVDELKKISGLNFQYDVNTKLVDVSVYPNLFGMTLTAAREAYRENDDRWPGKIVLWLWEYEYRSSNAMTQSQARNLTNEIVSSINKIGGKVKISRSSDSSYKIEGWLNNRRLDIALYPKDKKYELSIDVIETEGKYSPYNQQ